MKGIGSNDNGVYFFWAEPYGPYFVPSVTTCKHGYSVEIISPYGVHDAGIYARLSLVYDNVSHVVLPRGEVIRHPLRLDGAALHQTVRTTSVNVRLIRFTPLRPAREETDPLFPDEEGVDRFLSEWARGGV